jgi:hypothetical protein
MNNIYGITNTAMLERMETLPDGPDGEKLLMKWLKGHKEIEVSPKLWFIRYDDGTVGTRCPTPLIDELPDPMTNLMYEWNFHFASDMIEEQHQQSDEPWLDDDESDDRSGAVAAKFYGE